MTVSRSLFCRNGLAPLLAGVCLTLACGSPSPAAEPARPPNFLIFVADDLGWNDIGYHNADMRTPHLDRLAKSGVRLERHYVYPTCSPTRAGLLTGRNPSRFGVNDALPLFVNRFRKQATDSLPLGTLTLAQLLKTQGYATALCGKWHLGEYPNTGPRKYGFDRTYGSFRGQIDPYTHRYKDGKRTWHRNDELVDETGHATDLLADEAVRFLTAERKGPFFLYMAFSVPHHPLAEEEKWLAPYRDTIQDPSRRLFAASVTHMDAAIGRIIEPLEKTGEIRNTVILFTSDNGGQRGWQSKTQYDGKYNHSVLGDNRPWHGWKTQFYEGGIRVPAFVSWPGRLPPAVVEKTASYLDWFPTFARWAGTRLDAGWKLEGRDLGPLLTGTGAPPAEPTLYWNIDHAVAVLHDNWKLIVSQLPAAAVELYNLAEDPRETKNLAATNPGKVEELRQILARQKGLDP